MHRSARDKQYVFLTHSNTVFPNDFPTISPCAKKCSLELPLPFSLAATAKPIPDAAALAVPTNANNGAEAAAVAAVVATATPDKAARPKYLMKRSSSCLSARSMAFSGRCELVLENRNGLLHCKVHEQA